MRNQLSFLLAFFLTLALPWQSGAAVKAEGVSSATGVTVGTYLAFGTDGQYGAMANLSPEEFLNLKAKDIHELTGEKLNLPERMAFGVVKRQLKRQMKKAAKADSPDNIDKVDIFGFSLLWFIIGALTGPIGVIVSIFFGKNALLSSLIGFVIFGVWFGIAVF